MSIEKTASANINSLDGITLQIEQTSIAKAKLSFETGSTGNAKGGEQQLPRLDLVDGNQNAARTLSPIEVAAGPWPVPSREQRRRVRGLPVEPPPTPPPLLPQIEQKDEVPKTSNGKVENEA